jgi:hypothetical protein
MDGFRSDGRAERRFRAFADAGRASTVNLGHKPPGCQRGSHPWRGREPSPLVGVVWAARSQDDRGESLR